MCQVAASIALTCFCALRALRGLPYYYYRYDAPSASTPSLSLSVPSAQASPLPHLVRLCFQPTLFRPYSLAVRFLPADESPTHAAFVADSSAGTSNRADPLGDKCADLMSSL